MEMTAKKARLDWIDWMKAVAMMAVVLGHMPTSDGLDKYVYSFHLPLFFILSGMVFNPDKDKTLKDFLIHKGKGILLPYFCISYTYMVFYTIFERGIVGVDISLIELIKGVLYCNAGKYYIVPGPTWFLPALFMIELAAYIILRCIGTSAQRVFLMAAICMVLGVVETNMHPGIVTPWNIVGVPMNVGLFLIGFAVFRCMKDGTFKCFEWNSHWQRIVVGIVCVLAGMWCGLTNDRVSYGGNVYHVAVLALLAIGCTAVGLYLLIQYIGKIPVVGCLLSQAGSNTLMILGYHRLVIRLTKRYMPTLMTSDLRCLVYSAIVMIGFALISVPINKWIPFGIGKFEKAPHKKVNYIGFLIYTAVLIPVLIIGFRPV